MYKSPNELWLIINCRNQCHGSYREIRGIEHNKYSADERNSIYNRKLSEYYTFKFTNFLTRIERFHKFDINYGVGGQNYQ